MSKKKKNKKISVETIAAGAEENAVSFEQSLSMLTPENIVSGSQTADITKTKNKFDPVRLIILAVCTLVCIVSSFMLIQNVYGKYKSAKIYENASKFVEGNTDGYISLLEGEAPAPATPTLAEMIQSGAPQTPSNSVKDMAKMIAGLDALAKINPDAYAWIRIEGVGVNYPVLQAEDNEYYLDHAYTGDNIPNGSIFADYRCDGKVTNNYNTILYGHNMTGGSMFGGLVEFVRQEDVFKNARIYVYTFDGVYIYRAFSAYQTSYDSGYITTYFETPGEYSAFLEEIASRSIFTPDDEIELREDRGILTLSTCTNGNRNDRYAIHAALVDYVLK